MTLLRNIFSILLFLGTFFQPSVTPVSFVDTATQEIHTEYEVDIVNDATAQSLDFLAPPQHEHYVFIGGQSNAVGLATNPGAYGLTGVISNAKIYFSSTYQNLEFDVNNQAFGAGLFGPELSLGKYLGAAANRPVYLAKYAVVGAALADVPGNNDFAPNSLQYNALVQNITNSYNALPASQYPFFKTFVWVQGEQDGAAGGVGNPTLYSSVYDVNWANFIAALEVSIGFTFDRIIISQLSENQRAGYITTAAGFDQIREKQEVIVASGARYRMVDASNFATLFDYAHYNNSGYNDLGIAIAKKILGQTIAPVAADPSWSPIQYTGCKLWLDAKQGVTLTSGKVSQWNDQSSSANHATQSNASLRPTYDDPNDRVVFDGTTYLDLSAHVDDFKSDTQGEMIVIFKRTNTTTNNFIFSFSITSAANSYYALMVNNSTGGPANKVWSFLQNGLGSPSQVYSTDEVPGTDNIVSVANNSFSYHVWNNSIHESALTASLGSHTVTGWLSNFVTPPTTVTIGGLVRTTNFLVPSEIWAVVYFDHMLKYEERQALRTYFINYYGL